MKANYRIFTLKNDLLKVYEEVCVFLNTLKKEQVISITCMNGDYIVWFWQAEDFLEIE